MRNKLLIVMLFLLLGCTTTKYVEVPVDRVKWEYSNNMIIDTLIVNDSSIIRERGDTVFVEKYKYLYRIKEVKDTVLKVDTITKIQTVVQQEKKESKSSFSILYIILVLSILSFIVYKYISRKS